MASLCLCKDVVHAHGDLLPTCDKTQYSDSTAIYVVIETDKDVLSVSIKVVEFLQDLG